MRNEVKDSKGFYRGWSDEDQLEIRYFGITKGYIGRFDKKAGCWYWMSGPNVGKRGPFGDIGYSEVLKAERAM